eukprot:4246285-Amphidinium_carterae.1
MVADAQDVCKLLMPIAVRWKRSKDHEVVSGMKKQHQAMFKKYDQARSAFMNMMKYVGEKEAASLERSGA